jgi:hypothetical protein
MVKKFKDVKVSEDGKLNVKDPKKAIKLIVELLGGMQLQPGFSEDQSNHYKEIYNELQEIIKEEKDDEIFS